MTRDYLSRISDGSARYVSATRSRKRRPRNANPRYWAQCVCGWWHGRNRRCACSNCLRIAERAVRKRYPDLAEHLVYRLTWSYYNKAHR